MTLVRRVLLALGLALLIAEPAFAIAGPASKFISDLGSEALRMLNENRADAQRREGEFRRLFVKNFDVNTIARFVVGNHWRDASDAERTEYRKLFEDYIVAAYSARLGNYSGEQFQVKDEVAAGDDTVVNSVILHPNGPPTRVEWRVRGANDGLKIVDVVIEGVSMTITQRSEFASVMQQGGKGLSSLNERLREKVGGTRSN